MRDPWILCATIAVGSLICWPARAQNWWSVTGATALPAPERTRVSVAKTMSFFDSLRGPGVHLAPGALGSAVLYVPVNVPDRIVLRSIRVRVSGLASGTVAAELYRQPVDGGLPIRIGTLGVADTSTSGPFMRWAVLPSDVVVDHSRNIYYFRVELCKDPSSSIPGAITSSSYDTTVYSVAITDTRCSGGTCGPGPPNPPIWPMRACKY